MLRLMNFVEEQHAKRRSQVPHRLADRRALAIPFPASLLLMHDDLQILACAALADSEGNEIPERRRSGVGMRALDVSPFTREQWITQSKRNHSHRCGGALFLLEQNLCHHAFVFVI
jgi:hypothetical protein